MWFDTVGVDERGVHRKRVPRLKYEEELGINLTPMLDVVMIMLIFFIVAGTFINEYGIDMEREHTTNQQSDKPSEGIIVQVSAADEIWFEGRRIDARSVRANISRVKAERPQAKLVIRAHVKSHVAAITDVADSAREAGVYNVALSTAH